MMIRSRRDILKGLSFGAGGALLTPFMHQIKLQAEGNSAALPKRFVFVVKSSGVSPEGITPESLRGDDAKNESLKEVQLQPSMKALEPYRDQLSIVQGLSGKMCRGGTAVHG